MTAVTKLMTPGGGGVALTPASSIASDVTVNVPSQNCTLGIQGPAFSAGMSGTVSVANNTWTKATFNVKIFDTNNNFDATTNYRFTPTIAGYYQVNVNFPTANSSSGSSNYAVYKNGSIYSAMSAINTTATYASGFSCIVYLNGATDYIETYIIQGSGTSQAMGSPNSAYTYFQAAMVRSA